MEKLKLQAEMEKMKQQNELERLRLETKNQADMQALKQKNQEDKARLEAEQKKQEAEKQAAEQKKLEAERQAADQKAKQPIDKKTIEDYLQLDPRSVGKFGKKITDDHMELYNLLKPIDLAKLEYYYSWASHNEDNIKYDGATFENLAQR